MGYDILSFGTDGSERLLEVKTTRRGPYFPFSVTRRELEVSRERQASYRLVRVFNFEGRKQSHYRMPGCLEASCRLVPTVFEATPG